MFTISISRQVRSNSDPMEAEYLEEGFDPKSLKVAQLRRILVEHDVSLSGGLKKADLCELFEEYIIPRREELLKEKNIGPGKEAIDKSGDTSLSREVSTGRSESPFSDVNDFQKDTVLPQKRRREKEPVKSKKKKGRKSRTVDSPIVDKVQNLRSPSKPSPHKSLVIDKFESSSEHSSSSSEDIADFSFRRKTVSPDLSKLKVSAAFAEQLAKVAKQSQSTPSKDTKQEEQENYPPSEEEHAPTHSSPVTRSSKASKEASFDNMPSFSGIKEEASPALESEAKESSKIDTKEDEADETEKEEDNETHESTPILKSSSSSPVTTPNVENEQDPNETVQSSEAEDNDESIALGELEREASFQKIATPELATEEDVKKMDDTVKNATVQQQLESPRIGFRTVAFRTIKSIIRKVFHLVILLTGIASILFGLWYREERIQVGYCGREINLPTFQNPDNLPWINDVEILLQKFKPECLPCPENAICYPYMQIKCKPDYVVTHSMLSLHGLFPVSDYCVKDSQKENLISEVVKKSLELLRTKNAQIKCGEGEDDFESGVSNQELYQIFYESRAPWINSEEFDDLWDQIVEDLKSEPEITWRQLPTFGRDIPRDSHGSTETYDVQEPEGDFPDRQKNGTFRSTSKKYIGLKCKFEREVHQTYQRFKYVIWSIALIVVTAEGLKYRLRKYFKQQEKIEQLTQQVLVKLQNAARDTDDSKPPYLSTVQLRDVLLADIVDLKYKNQLWKLVVKKLEHNNTNIKSTLMEVHGEIMKCWQWIGPLADDDH